MNAREEILGAVRAATADAPEPPAPSPLPQRSGGADLLLDFLARAADFGARTATVAPNDLSVAVEGELARRGAQRLLVPPDLPPEWVPAGAAEVRDDGTLSLEEIDAAGAVLTGCALAVAETGTLAFDGGPSQGRRVLTLLPDLHICVLRADQVVADVDSAFRRLGERMRERPSPITLVSGPSATSDIELKRVVGVHGPRHLTVFALDGGA